MVKTVIFFIGIVCCGRDFSIRPEIDPLRRVRLSLDFRKQFAEFFDFGRAFFQGRHADLAAECGKRQQGFEFIARRVLPERHSFAFIRAESESSLALQFDDFFKCHD